MQSSMDIALRVSAHSIVSAGVEAFVLEGASFFEYTYAILQIMTLPWRVKQ